MTLPASPVGQKPIKHFPPDGDSSPSSDGQSSIFSEPQERRHPYFLTPRVPLSGFLCPVQAACASLQEDGTVQIEKEFPKGKERGWRSQGSFLVHIKKIAQCVSGMVHASWSYGESAGGGGRGEKEQD